MNGEEVEVLKAPETPKITGGRFVELTEMERMDLVVLSASPSYKTLQKLFELEVIHARDEAMLTPPYEQQKRLALMDVAYSIARFSEHIQRRIENAVSDHRGKLSAAAANEAIREQSFIEAVITGQFPSQHQQ